MTKVEEEARRDYGERVIIFKGPIAHTDKARGEAALASGMKTLVDWWLLTETDFNIISWSMFGFSASYKAGRAYAFGEGDCDNDSTIVDVPFPHPPMCMQQKGYKEKCRILHEDLSTSWNIGDSYS